MSVPALVRLTYWSLARTSTDDAALAHILESSQRRNRADAITGVLLFHRGRFVQALEGERDVVTGCYSRILQDRRHEGCVLLGVESIAAGSFSQWSMGRLPVSGEDAAVVDLLLAQLRDFSPSVSHPAATAILHALARKIGGA